MHKHLFAHLRTLVAALALAAPLAQASVINFDQPAVIDIDNATGQGVYREAGFALSGDAAGFLQLDGIGTGGSAGLFLLAGNTLSIMAGNGGLFSFMGLDAGAYDPSAPATLDILGIYADNTQQSLPLSLAGLGMFAVSPWSGLTELRLTARADAILDNVAVSSSGSAVPEPGSAAMLMLGFGVLLGVRRSGRARRAR
jgi:hypothetical protein